MAARVLKNIFVKNAPYTARLTNRGIKNTIPSRIAIMPWKGFFWCCAIAMIHNTVPAKKNALPTTTLAKSTAASPETCAAIKPPYPTPSPMPCMVPASLFSRDFFLWAGWGTAFIGRRRLSSLYAGTSRCWHTLPSAVTTWAILALLM